ncbi:MAG: hypothetical protein F4X14_15750 [Caldilineaceae bacterium SB0661_bin_32]|uniref:Uncharacterized protein n=1 Tax=Caldilineaceae bacterium SB0661_bin_32 TaxID=2605255 RepID=A0A6B1D9N8_9CHLR|nr:hypothetical protein [Caldilineaceae bacterium SB0661_bin_32]
MQAPNFGRLPALLLCAAVVFAVFYAASAITPSFASEGDGHGHEDEAPTLETLTERIAGLEARVAELETVEDEMAAEKLAYSVFDAVSAAYLLDKVDIHALHKRLNDGEGIMPGDAGQIKYLVPLLTAVDWPQELAEEAETLTETLTKLTAALADDDLESALPLSAAAHDRQHHFSSSVFDWFACLQLPEEEMEADEQGEGEQSETSHDDHGHSHDDDETSEDNGAQDSGNDNCVEDESNGIHDDGHDHSHGG